MPIGTRISKSMITKRQYENKSEVYIIEVMTKAVTTAAKIYTVIAVSASLLMELYAYTGYIPLN